MSKSNLCIYCKSTDSEKFKGVEHVLPQGFGLFGTDTPTLPGCVCDDCNGLLGKTIDQHLTRETLEGLARYNKGILSRETRPQTRLHITLENTPEIGEFGGMKVAIDGNARKLMPVKTQYMVLNKKTGEWEYFFEENIPGIQLSEAVYGKHGADGVKGDREHKSFAQSKEEADKMIALLEENGIQFVPGEPFSTPKPLAQNGEAAVFIEGEVMPEQRRAHAKIFLNLIAYHLGCDEAMKSHWDFLRRYVRFAEGEIRYRMVDRPEVPPDDKRIIVKIQNLNGHVVGSIQFYGNETYQYILREMATVAASSRGWNPALEQWAFTTSVSGMTTTLPSTRELLAIAAARRMLWPPGADRRVPWRDVTSRALTNERWPWLPPKGLDTLRRIAEGTGRWRYSEDGYIEKGPFPKAKTKVLVSERDYKEETGAATLEVIARDSGPHGRVHFAPDQNVNANSPCLPETVYETTDTVLWFLAVDPDGEHETGEAKRWENKLTLTHERVILPGGKRRVELSVKPRGTIRWNVTGANAKEGRVYTGPIDISGDAETTVYAYAEDKGVGAVRNIIIPRVDQAGPSIIKTQSARLRKKLEFRGTTEAFVALSSLESLHARVSGVAVTVGEGAKAIYTRFGSDIAIGGPVIRTVIEQARDTLANPTADVLLRLEDIAFNSGHDLETFVEKHRLDVATGDIDQS